MTSTADIKPFLGAAACVTLLALILLEPIFPAYELTDKVVVLLLALMSSFLGVDIFRQSAKQPIPDYMPTPPSPSPEADEIPTESPRLGPEPAPAPEPEPEPETEPELDWNTIVENWEDEAAKRK